MPSDLEELRQSMKATSRDAGRFNAAMRDLLGRHGFHYKSENGHTRMEPLPDFPGVQSVTLMKTPSDGRGLANSVSQIEGNLGITRLKQVR